MASSDRDLTVATQIAYMDFKVPKTQINKYTLRELMQMDRQNPEGLYNQQQAEIDRCKASGDTAGLKMAQDKMNIYNEILSNDSKYGDWRIVDIEDQNSENGFYGCLIETGDKEAIVGFRGSENMKDPSNLLNDWIDADVGLLNSTETRQQEAATQYMNKIAEKYGDEYDSFELTGHSLGGNLAAHATITAPDEIKGKIVRTLSIDGPGFSDEYIRAHSDEIDEMSGLIDHYQYSLVGALLNPLPGEHFRTIQTTEDAENEPFNRHSTAYIKFDKNGEVSDGEMDDLAAKMNGVSNYADDESSWGGIFGALQILPLLIIDGGYAFVTGGEDAVWNFFRDYSTDYSRYRKNNIAGKADFKIQPVILSNAAEEIGNYSSQIDNMSENLRSIKNEMSLVLKAASLFTLCFKLNKYIRDLEKEKSKMDRMMTAARTCAEYYNTYESRVVSGAAV